MGFSTSTCTEFVEVLASKAPVPGGGGASALVGAVGTALGNMVGSLTVGKKKYADVEEEMWELKGKCDQLQKDFLRLIERDAEVFEPLSKAYGMPKETEEEILEALKPNYIDGLSLLGGEPFEPENQEVLVKLLRKVKERYPEKNIWCYSGYLFDEELKKESRARCEYTDEMLSMLDVLVDGRFEEDKKNITLLFRGSENQRLIDVKKSLEQDKVVEWKPAIKRGL